MVKTIASSPKVSVVLLNWNGAEFTIPCVESLHAQSYANLETIVVDNGSSDDSCSRLREKFGGSIRFVPLDKNLGFTGGNNVGIDLALKGGASYVLVLNNDTIADARLVEELVALAESDKGIGVVTGKIFYFDRRDLLWFAGGVIRRGFLEFKHRGLLKKDTGEFDTICESRFVTGCCMLVRREVFERVGVFDNRFFIYSEDADFSLRVSGAGFRLMYTPRAVLWHKESATMRKNTLRAGFGTVSPRQYYLSTRNRIFILRKHSPALEKTVTLSSLVLQSLLWSSFFVVRGRWEKLSSIWRGVFDGLFTEMRDEREFTH